MTDQSLTISSLLIIALLVFIEIRSVLGRTIPSWRMVVEAEMARLKKFQDSLSPDERLLFQDLLLECKLYAPYASVMASPVKEIPFLISMLFGQHKRIVELEKKIVSLQTIMRRNQQNDLTVAAQNWPSQIITK